MRQQKSLIIQDRIHGTVEITEPIVIELIKSNALQRLKNVDQAGYTPNSSNTHASVNRFEHSVGCYILLQKFGAPLEEQLAGLIHDVSHSAFSHCSDYILEGGSQSQHTHQDNMFKEIVLKSEMPTILKKYGFDINYILDDSNFPLQEKDLPDLCADRIDYSLREMVCKKEILQSDALYILSKLKTKNNKWIFDDYESAREHTELFSKLNRVYLSSFDSAVMFNSVGETMKYALQKKYITEEDLYTTDKVVLSKVRAKLSNDEVLAKLYRRMDRMTIVKNDADNYDYHVLCKSRVVDPLCKHDGEVVRVSDIDKEYGNNLVNNLKPKEYYLRYSD